MSDEEGQVPPGAPEELTVLFGGEHRGSDIIVLRRVIDRQECRRIPASGLNIEIVIAGK